MASKAHIINDYSFGNARHRPRQLLFRRQDPVVLPRTSIWRAGGGAIATALAMGAIVVGSVYAAYREPPPQLAETPALAPLENWQPDASVGAARMTNLLQGPALSVPDKAAPFFAAEADAGEDVPSTSFVSPSQSSSTEPRSSESREVIIDDSKMYPPAATPAPYPNPTTTPPDAVAPPATNVTPPPATDAENPYRDSEQL